ncbi:DUF1949 domain-containing protein, partial [Oscillochloris sp. ZM17-4]|uniref:DUF1949 domain-containing protein n=1 Tax=Oscillochloris sp. ZM17-4 TaxID=2866714 RepID=UPI001C73CF95
LEVLPRGEHVELRSMLVRMSYSDYAAIRRALESHGAAIDDEEFAADVCIATSLPAADHARCVADLAEISAGRAQVELL